MEVIEAEIVESGADFLQDRANSIRNTVRRIPYAIAQVGAMLLEVKEHLDHGEFLAWIKAEFDWDERAAQRFMAVARRLNPTTLSDLRIQPSALYLLTAPSTPDEVLDRALEKAQTSEVTLKQAKQLLKAKPEKSEEEWNPDNWETPDWLAKALAGLLEPHEKEILEPTAGTGQIANYLPANSVCVEIDEANFTAGAGTLPEQRWYESDILAFEAWGAFDVVLGNLPFSRAMPILAHCLKLIKPEGRCLFIMPLDFFSSQQRAKEFAELNAYIQQVHWIVGRVAYLKNGEPFDHRQVYDGIFDIRLGDSEEVFVWPPT